MMIHPTAVVDSAAQIAEGAEVGPYVIIGPDVILGPGVKLGPFVVVTGKTHLHAGVQVHAGAILGGEAQDRKDPGLDSGLEVGPRTVIREYCTVNRGTQGGWTRIGEDVLLMAYVHVAHDCQIADRATLANKVQLGGHVQIGSGAVLGGCAAVHQFCRVGAFSYIGGTLKIDRDIPPGIKAFGDPLRFAGINRVGLERAGVDKREVELLEEQYRHLRKLTWVQWLQKSDTDINPLGLRSFVLEGQGGLLALQSSISEI